MYKAGINKKLVYYQSHGGFAKMIKTFFVRLVRMIAWELIFPTFKHYVSPEHVLKNTSIVNNHILPASVFFLLAM